jgi:DNA-binding winged helix-turn-helix (wHTH) protein
VSATTRFADFTLDHDTRELRRGRTAIKLSPKALQLLELLIAHRPKALSKQTLQEQLWPDTFVVEKNLVNLIAEIRLALGDDPARPQFVRTVQRFGYAFQDVSPEPDTSGGRRSDAGRPDASFRIVWSAGRAGLGDGEHVLGRDPDLLLFLDSPSVSRRHALIRVAGNRATIEDLDSKNGTFVGDQRVAAEAPLGDGDVIRVGSIQLTIKALHARGPTETEPPSS